MLLRKIQQYSINLIQWLMLSIGLLLSNTGLSTESLINPSPSARHLTSLGNINLGEVNNIFQSRDGYMWLSTNEGLIRFDGYTSKVFSYDPADQTGIGHNRIFDAVEDKQGILWLSSFGGGLIKYDPTTEQFSTIDLKSQLNNPKVPDTLYWLTLTDSGLLWISSSSNIWLFDTIKQTAVPVPGALQEIPDRIMGHVYVDNKERVWVGSNYDGVFMYDGQVLHRFSDEHGPSPRIGDKLVRQIYQDAQQRLWLAMRNGLYLFNEQNQSWTRYTPSSQAKLANHSDDIFSILGDDSGKQLWVGSLRHGVLTFNPATGLFKSLSFDNDLSQQFKQIRINRIYKDQAGSLWFAAHEGLIYLSKSAQKFDYISNTSATFKTTYLAETSPGKIHFAANYNLYKITGDTYVTHPVLIDDNKIFRFEKDAQNTFWAATMGGGLMRFHANFAALTRDAQPASKNQPPVWGIFGLLIDSQDRIWLGALPDTPRTFGGLVSFDKQQKIETWHHTEPTYGDMLELSEDHLLLGSIPDGLISYKPSDNTRIYWSKLIDDAPNRVQTLLQDSKGRLWLGSESKGLTLFDLAAKKMTHFNKNDGLLSNHIVSIVEDKQQNLWLGSPVGLSRFNPEDQSILNLEKQDGLLFSSFYRRAAMAADNGDLLFGTRSGIIRINPTEFNNVTPATQPKINEFKLFNKTVAISTKDAPTVLQQSIEFTDAIELSADDYVFSFGFSATQYQRPDKIQYAYRMLGLDDQWIYTTASNRVASYTTLTGGNYTFEVKASNAQGHWSNQVASIQLTVLPPWYLTWQAYLAYFITAVVSLYLYIRSHTLTLKKQAKELESKVTERTEQLQKSTDELAKQSQTVSALLAQKQQLFASVSHEFRTPLTLILSPIEQMLKRYDDHVLNQELGLIKRNGRRLLRMVDQLLEFAKLEQQQKIQPEPVALQPTMEVIAASFSTLVQSKQLSLTVNPCPDAILMMLPDSLNKILINLLSNAFKYTPNGGAIAVSTQINDGLVSIEVKDNGIGIAQHDQQTVFERFHRATHDHGETIIGAGIGLSLVKELVEANDGKITLESQLNQGSTFIITLPLADPSVQSSHRANYKVPPAESFQLEMDNIHAQDTQLTPENTISDDDSKKSVLIIDDNADMRNLLRSQLSEQYHCIEALNGEVGLNTAKEHIPDMILSDIMMPVMDGYELAEKLKADMLTSHIPIIMLTAKGSVESRIKGLKLLIDDYLPKPFDIQELQLRIHNILMIREIVAKRSLQSLEQAHNDQNLQDSTTEPLDLNPLEQQFVDMLNTELSEGHHEVDFGAKALSEKLLLSERQLHRKIKALFNSSIPEYVRNYRLRKSLEMLEQGHKASQVYFNVGFSSHSYFSSCFKAKYGKTPSDYQKRQLQQGVHKH